MPCAQHHRVRGDESVRCFHADGAAALDPDPGDRRVLEDARATHLGALGERLRGIDGIGLAVLGQEDAAHQIVDHQQRPAFPDLAGREHIDLQAKGLAHRGAATQLLEACLGLGHADRAVLPEAGRLPGLGFQRVVQVGGVLGQFRQVARRAQLPDQPRGMPGRAAGQFPTLEQHDVADAQLGQVIGDRAAGDSAADYHDARACRGRHR